MKVEGERLVVGCPRGETLSPRLTKSRAFRSFFDFPNSFHTHHISQSYVRQLEKQRGEREFRCQIIIITGDTHLQNRGVKRPCRLEVGVSITVIN